MVGLGVDPVPGPGKGVEGKPQKARIKIAKPPEKQPEKPKNEKPKEKPPKLGEPVPEKAVPKPGKKKEETTLTGPLVLAEPTTNGGAKSIFQVLLARVAGDKPNAADLEALARHMRDTTAND